MTTAANVATPPAGLKHSPLSHSLNLVSPDPPTLAAKASTNFHPYLIQTTASSLLTRSNTSPAPPPGVTPTHRHTRSMGSLAHVHEDSPLKYMIGQHMPGTPGTPGTPTRFEGTPGGPKTDRRRWSTDSPSGMRRSGKMRSIQTEEEVKKPELPADPKAWSRESSSA